MDQKLEIINNWNLQKFFSELEAGSVQIPKFQRDFVWEKSKLVKLLNSIYCQYPIGSFFLWQAPAEDYAGYIRGEEGLFGKHKTQSSVQFVLDGQQRATALYLALKGINWNGTLLRNVFFSLEKRQFLGSRSGGHCIAAWKVLDNVQFGETLADLAIKDRQNSTRFADEWRKCHEIFTNYPLSIVKTYTQDIEDVVEIFERINQSGKRLTVYDLVHAATCSEDFDLNAKIKEFSALYLNAELGSLQLKTAIAALTINSYGSFSNALQLKLSAIVCKEHWAQTAQALAQAVAFVTSMGIKEDIAPYANLLPVLQYRFYCAGKEDLDSVVRTQLEKWFWDAKISNRYASLSLTAIKKDLQLMKQLAK